MVVVHTMHEVKIEHEKPLNIMAIVQELREYGYKQTYDFDFQYIPASWEDGVLTPRHTIFRFYTDSVASWFAMKYV